MSEETLLEFPCQFPIKVMGSATPDFSEKVRRIVCKHAGDIADHAVRERPSGQGNYLSVTVTITANSKQQLDNIYLELNGCDWIVMTL